MYTEITKEDLIEEAELVRDFVIVKGLQSNQLIELANNLKERKESIVEVYLLDAADTINYPSFSSIKMNDGLIFPQSDPIILVIANFDKLQKEDQDKYLLAICKKEEHDYYPHHYLHEESIVIIGISSTSKEPKISFKLEVRSVI